MYIRNPKQPSPHEQRASMFNHKNKCGYKVNINHPNIAPLLLQFKKDKKLSLVYPMSDGERFEFEKHVFQLFGLSSNLKNE